MIRLELLLSGMLSVHAKHAVFSALSGVPGLSSLEIELGRVVLDAERAETELSTLEEELRGAISAAGLTLTALRRLPRQLPTL